MTLFLKNTFAHSPFVPNRLCYLKLNESETQAFVKTSTDTRAKNIKNFAKLKRQLQAEQKSGSYTEETLDNALFHLTGTLLEAQHKGVNDKKYNVKKLLPHRADVIMLQALLDAADYSPTWLDGKYGRRTNGALKKFQKGVGAEDGLEPGKFDIKTLQTLFTHLRENVKGAANDSRNDLLKQVRTDKSAWPLARKKPVDIARVLQKLQVCKLDELYGAINQDTLVDLFRTMDFDEFAELQEELKPKGLKSVFYVLGLDKITVKDDVEKVVAKKCKDDRLCRYFLRSAGILKGCPLFKVNGNKMGLFPMTVKEINDAQINPFNIEEAVDFMLKKYTPSKTGEKYKITPEVVKDAEYHLYTTKNGVLESTKRPLILSYSTLGKTNPPLAMMIDYVCRIFIIRPDIIYTFIGQESGFRTTNTRGDKGVAAGLGQFHPLTFKSYIKTPKVKEVMQSVYGKKHARRHTRRENYLADVAVLAAFLDKIAKTGKIDLSKPLKTEDLVYLRTAYRSSRGTDMAEKVRAAYRKNNVINKNFVERGTKHNMGFIPRYKRFRSGYDKYLAKSGTPAPSIAIASANPPKQNEKG